MRNSVSISLPDGILKQLKAQSKSEDASWSEVVRKALQSYFYKSEFSRLRQQAMGEAAKKGIFLTEDDVFKNIS